MNTFSTDANNDVALTSGNISIVYDSKAIRNKIDNALRIIKGELDDPKIGVDYFNIIMAKTPISMKVQELVRVINSVDGVKETLFNKVNYDAQRQVYNFYFTINSIYGDINYETNIDLTTI